MSTRSGTFAFSLLAALASLALAASPAFLPTLGTLQQESAASRYAGDGADATGGGAYACPPGGAPTLASSVCARAFGSATEYLVEPDLAVFAGDTRIMALAANDGQSVDGLSPALAGSLETRMQRMPVFVTDDGGASWTRRELPAPPAPPQPYTGGPVPLDVQLWDPSIAFGPDGDLHLAGVLIWAGVDGSAKQKRVFHTESSDLGATWSPYQIFGLRVDRPWLTIERDGDLHLVWWEASGTSLASARSGDGGATWTRATGPGPTCHFPSPPVELGADLLVACVRDERFVVDEQTPARAVYRFDEAEDAWQRVGALSAMSTPRLFPLADGSLFLAAGVWNETDVILQRSVDGGATWQDLPRLAERLSGPAGSWWFLQMMGGREDPWGNVHLFVRGIDLPERPSVPQADPFLDLPAFLAGVYSDEFAVAHVVLDPTTGDILSEQVLTPEVSHAPTGNPGAGVGRAGDYYGIAFTEEEAVLAWEYQRSLFLTHWQP